jgi:hypothetical protein
MLFRTLRDAHKYYKYPSTHRFGTIGNENGVIRSYSNGVNCDKILESGKVIYYRIKNDRIKKMYQTSIDNKKKVRFFRKVKDGVLNASHSLYLPVRFHKGFVKLLKN